MQNGDQAVPQWLGHPKGLFYLFFAELWERFSFYGMRALLTLYMVNQVFEALANRDTVSALVYSAYGSLVYASPAIGGKIADQILGYRKSIILGGILMSIGHFVLAIDNIYAFFLALGFLVVGNGFFKPNISTFVGSLYPEGDMRKDSGFTIFYMGINIGATIAPLLCGWLGATYGWHYGFGLAGVGMLAGLIFFYSGIQRGVFGNKGLPPNQEIINKKVAGLKLTTFVPVIAVLAVPVIAYLISSYEFIGNGATILGEVTIVNVIFYFISIAIFIYIGYEMFISTAEERGKLAVAVMITVFMTLFWGFHELSGSVITLFADRNVMLPTFGDWSFGAAETNAINPSFIILLSIPVSIMWTWLAKRNLNPRTPFKFAFGLAFLGVGFLLLSWSGAAANESGMVPFFYLVLMYLLISAGELFMSPVGLSKITSLSPVRIVAFMMGVWFLASAYAFQIVGFIGQKLAIEDVDGVSATGLQSLAVYTDGFELIAYYALGGALIASLLSIVLNKWSGNVH